VVETGRKVMAGMWRRSVHAGKRVANFARQSPGVLRSPAGIARPLARAYPGETLEQDSTRIPAAHAKSRMPMRHMIVPRQVVFDVQTFGVKSGNELFATKKHFRIVRSNYAEIGAQV
jgi:hypothetical protein